MILNINFALAIFDKSAFYGYGQIDYSISNKKGEKAKFDVTRLNLIGEFELSSQSRFISDIELEDNTLINPKGTIGSLKFSQLWAEYAFFPELKARAGKILTNFGLYNKIHDASPTYFSISPPILYNRQSPANQFPDKQRYFSKYLLGTELTGIFELDDECSQLEYSLMFGNGRNDFVGSAYVGDNTCYAARLVYRPAFCDGFHIGTSFYNDENKIGMAGVKNSREITYGLDLEYEFAEFQIQLESIIGNFTDENNQKINSSLNYLQIAYTFNSVYTPYIQLNYLNLNPNENNNTSLAIFGVNYALSSKFYLKLEGQYNYIKANNTTAEFGMLKSSISVAF